MKEEQKKHYHMYSGDLAKEISHGICISNLAYRVGKELSLDEDMCYNLAVMGLLHDVGKQEMIRTVRKRGGETALRVEEMRYLRTHPVLGYALLKEQGYPEELTQWVLYHHENYDGSGYPANKVGEEIPLGARILHVCETFGALTAQRPYRNSYSVEEAMRQMIGEVKNYDMKVFLALMNVVHESRPEELLDRQDLVLDQSFFQDLSPLKEKQKN